MRVVSLPSGKKRSKGDYMLAQRQALLDARGVRKHKKRHNENKERSFRDRTKARKCKQLLAQKVAKHRKIKAIVAAYFRGEEPDLNKAASLLGG